MGRIESVIPAGDRIAFLLAPIEAEAVESFDEFSFRGAKRIEPGHGA